MCRTIDASGQLRVNFSSEGSATRLHPGTELALFRSVQELITNAIKHAAASQLNVQLTHSEQQLSIRVEDNGSGFDAKAPEYQPGMGITSIQKRVATLGASFTINAKLGKGTTALLNIPYNHTTSEPNAHDSLATAPGR